MQSNLGLRQHGAFRFMYLTLRRQRLYGWFGGLAALQELFFSPPGAGYARAWWRNKDLLGDNVSPNPALRKASYECRF